MLTGEESASLAVELQGSTTDLARKQAILQQYKAEFDAHATEAATAYTTALAPALLAVLRDGPGNDADADHAVRKASLELLARLKPDEQLKPLAVEILRTCLHVFATGTEDQALLALRQIMDIMRVYRQEKALEEQIPHVLQHFHSLFSRFQDMLQYYLGTVADKLKAEGTADDAGAPYATDRVPASMSFKLAIESSWHVLALLNLFQQVTVPHVDPLMQAFTAVGAIRDPEGYPAALQGVMYDFKMARMKAVCFMIYITKMSIANLPLAPYMTASVDNLMYCYETCPESHAPRKELLISTRNMIGSSWKKYLYPKLDLLIDEQFLLGTSQLVHETLGDFTMAMSVELVHNARAELTYEQLVKVVHMLRRHIASDHVNRSLQGTCCRLLVNLVEVMYGRRNLGAELEGHRQLLGKILDCWCSKLESLQEDVEQLIAAAEAEAAAKATETTTPTPGKQPPSTAPSQRTTPAPSETATTVSPVGSDADEGEGKGQGAEGQDGEEAWRTTVLHAQAPSEHTKAVTETCTLLHALYVGIKTGIFTLINYGNTRPNAPLRMGGAGMGGMAMAPLPHMGLREDELRVLSALLTAGIPCLRLFGVTQEGHEEYDTFADVTNVMVSQDGQDLVELWAPHLPLFFKACLQDPKLARVAAQILDHNPCGLYFMDVLLGYLVEERLACLRQPDTPEAKLTLRLFNNVFSVLGKLGAADAKALGMPTHPQASHHAERVVLLYIDSLLVNTMEEIRMCDDPVAFLRVLQALFRVLFTGKFTQLQASIAASNQLQPLLTTLHAVYNGPNAAPLRNTVVELCLMLPVPMQSLLPVIGQLTPQLLAALKGPHELVNLGLKVLDTFVEQINPEYLEPALAPIIDDLMHTLWGHMRPPPYPFGPKVAQLLGKMGGRNRAFVREPQPVEYKPNPEHSLRMIFTFEPSTSFLLPLDKCVMQATEALADTSKQGDLAIAHRKHALRLLQLTLSTLLNLRPPADCRVDVGEDAAKVAEALFGQGDAPHVPPPASKVELGSKTREQYAAENKALTLLLTSTMAAAGDTQLNPAADDFAQGVTRHMAMLFACGVTKPITIPTPGVYAGNKTAMLRELNATLFLPALLQVASDDDTHKADKGRELLALFLRTLLAVHGEQTRLGVQRVDRLGPEGSASGSLPAKVQLEALQKKPAGQLGLPLVLDELVPAVIHCLYEEKWSGRMAGIQCLDMLLDTLPNKLLWSWSPQIVHGALLVGAALPAHSNKERRMVEAFTQRVFSVLYPPTEGPGEGVGTVGVGGDVEMKEVGGGGDATPVSAEKAGASTKESSGPTPGQLSGKGSTLDKTLVLMARALFSLRNCANVQGLCTTALEVLQRHVHLTPSQLLTPFMDHVNPSLKQRRLLPLTDVDTCLGNAAALTYAMQLDPPLLPRHNPPDRVGRQMDQQGHAQDAYELLERLDGPSPETTLRVTRYPLNPATIAQLKVACLKLCAAFIKQPITEDPPLPKEEQELRQKITQLFFKHLVFGDGDVVTAARDGLQYVSANNRLPKEELQRGLKPILNSLPQYTKMSIPLLKGLGRLLDLLSNWFNVTLGDKIIDHLKKWLDPEANLAVAERAWVPGKEVEVATLMLDTFHLLPQSGVRFLESHEGRSGLVVLAINLENTLPQLYSMAIVPPTVPPARKHPSLLTSPYRVPLVRFLNRHAKEAVAYFLKPSRLCMPDYSNRLLDAVHSDMGAPLLDELCLHVDTLDAVLALEDGVGTGGGDGAPHGPAVAAAQGAAAQLTLEQRVEAKMQALHLLTIMVTKRPDWLPTQLYTRLLACWRAPQRAQRMQREMELTRNQLLESKRLAVCLLNYIGRHHDEVQPLFEVLHVLSVKGMVDYVEVRHFGHTTVPATYTLDDQRALVSHFISLFHPTTPTAGAADGATGPTPGYPEQMLVMSAKHLIIPMLKQGLGKDEGLIDGGSLKALVTGVLEPMDQQPDCYSDLLRMQLLDIVNVLITNIPDHLHDFRRQIINPGWMQLRGKQETMAKYHAFVAVCNFIKAFVTPAKTADQVFVALFRAASSDARRLLIREALDVLLPAAAEQVAQGSEEWKAIIPTWVQHMTTTLTQEAASSGHTLMVFQTLVRHAELFYPYRQAFMPQLISYCQRLGIAQTASVENRRTALDMAALVLRWERIRRERHPDVPLPPAAQGGPVVEVGRKRAREESVDGKGEGMGGEGGGEGGEQPAAKVIKTEEGQTVGQAPAADTAPMEDATPSDPDAVPPSAAVIEQLLRFLMRLVLVLIEYKDKDARALHAPCLRLIKVALELFPSASVNLQFAAVVLREPPQVGAPVGAGVGVVVDMMSMLMKHQPQAVVSKSPAILVALLEPVFASNDRVLVDKLVGIFRVFYTRFPVIKDSDNAEAQTVQNKVHEKLMNGFAQGFDPNKPVTDPIVLRNLCCTLVMLEALLDTVPEYAGRFVTQLCKLLLRVARDHAQAGGQLLINPHIRQPPPRGAPRPIREDAEYGTLPWAVAQILRLAAPRVLVHAETKKLFLQVLILLVSGPAARNLDPAITLEMLRLLRTWYLTPDAGAGSLSAKEGILLLQRFATFERVGGAESLPDGAWDSLFLDMLYTLCTQDIEFQGQSIKADAFRSIERRFLLGLRSRNPTTRAKFFQLLQESIPRDLYSRLKYIIMEQEWENVANTFWLRHGLDLLLATLRTNESITMAINSGRLPVLLPHTIQLVHSSEVLRQQGMAQRAGSMAPPRALSMKDSMPPPSSPTAGGVGVGAGGVEVKTEGAAAAATPTDQAATTIKTEPSTGPDAATGQTAGETVGQTAGQTTTPGGQTPATSAAAVASGGADVTPSPMEVDTTPAASGVAGGVGPPSSGGGESDVPVKPPAAPSPVQPEQPPVAPTFDRMGQVTPEVLALMKQHAAWLATEGNPSVRTLFESLREVSVYERAIPYHMWLLVFPIVWQTLPKEQQVTLAKPLISLLSREYHARQAMQRPNVVQAFLEAINVAQPQPKIPSELIKFLGKTFNSWNIAAHLLESHVLLFNSDWRCFHALSELYTGLGDYDQLAGLWKYRSRCADTISGMAMGQQGLLEGAQDVFLQAINTRLAKLNQGERLDVQKGELTLWHQQYMSTARELGQWGDLVDYALTTDNHAMMLDALSLTMKWQEIRDQWLPKARIEETTRIYIIYSHCSMTDGVLDGAEQAIKGGFNEALRRWWQLPASGLMCKHAPLMELQELMELIESIRIINSMNDMTGQYTDIKDILETWRLRTPNPWDSIASWSTLSVWRNHMYNMVINRFPSIPDANGLQQVGYRDKAWTVNQLARVARMQGHPSTAVHLVNTQYGYNAMEVQEAFVKITEQAKSYKLQSNGLTAALNFLNTTTMEYFQPQHQAEILRLKGTVLEALQEYDAANTAYSQAVTLYQLLPSGWTSWGGLCERQAQRVVHAAKESAMVVAEDGNGGGGDTSGGGTGAGSVTMLDATTQQQVDQWLQQAVTCYLQGIKQGSKRAVALVPRLLTMVSGDMSGAVAACLKDPKALGCVPAWMWLIWTPQLMTSLYRGDKVATRLILQILVRAFPQALYLPMRLMVVSARDAARAQQERERRQQEAGTPPDTDPISQAARAADTAALETAKELMDALRAKHTNPGLEQLVQELMGSRFVPRAEERLLLVLHVLLQRCYKNGLPDSAEVPAPLKKELANVCRACSASDGAGRAGRMSPSTVLFTERFIKGLIPDGPDFPNTLGEVVKRLKALKSSVQAVVEDLLPATMRLEEEAPLLTEHTLVSVEMPGQYMQDKEVNQDAVVYLEDISSSMQIIRRHFTSARRLTFLGSDGSARSFALQTGIPSNHPEERILQLLRMCNRLLDRHPGTRKRALRYHTPLVVPVWQSIRLVEDDPANVTYGEAYELNCARYGRDPERPITAFREKLPEFAAQPAVDPEGKPIDPRLSAFKYVEAKHVNENIFSQFVYKTIPNCDEMAVFKRQLLGQFSLVGLQTYLLMVASRGPTRLLLARNSGKTWITELYPMYDDNNMLERQEVVPFRLTRNLVVFFTPYGVEGPFVSSMAAAAKALAAEDEEFRCYLSLFFRDDLLYTHVRKARVVAQQQGQAATSSTAALVASVDAGKLQDMMVRNVDRLMGRLLQVAPAEISAGQAPPPNVQLGVIKLVELATSARCLCKLCPTWHPWY